jgi:hypothetical protein
MRLHLLKPEIVLIEAGNTISSRLKQYENAL